jgi:hypothetical protein
MSDAIFIVGYYRSGTSALSGALMRAGVKFYNEADPNEHNPLGFYEIPELIEFDVELFARLGVDWTDVRGLPPGWAERADLANMLTRLDGILRRRFTHEDRIWGLKHPHLCRTLPLYERAAKQAGHKPHVVHIFRDPWTAAASQSLKNGLTRAHSLLLWMSYVTNAERQARHLPRAWMTYQDLLARPAAELGRLAVELNLNLGNALGLEEAGAYLTTELNRSEPLSQIDLCRPVRDLVQAAWEAICQHQYTPALWDRFAADTADLVGFLTEIGASRGRVIPALGGSLSTTATTHSAPVLGLRPAERLDDGARARLTAMQERAGVLPSVAVIIVAPRGRAAAVNDTLESLNAQWLKPSKIKILAAEEVAIGGVTTIAVPPKPEAATRIACAELNLEAVAADYVAIINAGDTVSPDACLRFALTAKQHDSAMIYCDEIVPRASGAWVRHKPGWDVTRLRQAAYIGDWVWYRGREVLQLGGFQPDCAGAEEYEFQLRLAESGAKVTRLPEAMFTRSAESRRDDIKTDVFCARAAAALKQHLERTGQKADVQNRQHPGLFHHMRITTNPGTSIVLLCNGGEIAMLDTWLTDLLRDGAVSGPIILTGDALSESMHAYLTAVSAQCAALEGKVLAVPPLPGLTPSAALAKALALVNTPLTAILDVRAQPTAPRWLEGLRSRLADPGVAMAGARTLVPVGNDVRQTLVQGPIIIGADTRLGAGHMPDDPGPGGWLLVDQEASAIAPPGLLVRSAALQACEFPVLQGDALWIDLCAQLRAAGARLVWTPDISFIAPPDSVQLDGTSHFRDGGVTARALQWADPYHHPALSLHGDLLATEIRTGLVRSMPVDPASLLVSGPPAAGAPILNAARALRRAGIAEADWAPEMPGAADLGRRAPARWVRANPVRVPHAHSPGYTAVYTSVPEQEALPALAAAVSVFATSPGLVMQLRKLSPPGQPIALWRPALSPCIWRELTFGSGLNTRPRIIWFDEGIAPPWFTDLINETLESASWIVVERPGATYTGSLARIPMQESEFAWAQAMAELGPQIMVRPAHIETHADQYPFLIAAAAGCHILADDRLDLPESFPAVRLPARAAAWSLALKDAIAGLQVTLERGARTREAAMALPGLEDNPPSWSLTGRLADSFEGSAGKMRSAAE